MPTKKTENINKEATVSCRLHPDHAAQLKERAKREYLNLSGYVRQVLLKELERDHERAS